MGPDTCGDRQRHLHTFQHTMVQQAGAGEKLHNTASIQDDLMNSGIQHHNNNDAQ